VHELSISSAIVNTVVKHASGRRVSTVNMRIGALRQVVPTSLAFYFEIVARDTVCADAELELELVPALLRCSGCRREWDPAPEPALAGVLIPAFRCPACGEARAKTLTGDELEVESIEVEDTPSGVLSS
jgi:hydrogenase nickel incorporation protein HypA/HybF